MESEEHEAGGPVVHNAEGDHADHADHGHEHAAAESVKPAIRFVTEDTSGIHSDVAVTCKLVTISSDKIAVSRALVTAAYDRRVISENHVIVSTQCVKIAGHQYIR